MPIARRATPKRVEDFAGNPVRGAGEYFMYPLLVQHRHHFTRENFEVAPMSRGTAAGPGEHAVDERRARRNETGRRAGERGRGRASERDGASGTGQDGTERTGQDGQDKTDRTGRHRADRTGQDEGGLGNVDRLSHAGPVVGGTPAIYLAGMLYVRVR